MFKSWRGILTSLQSVNITEKFAAVNQPHYFNQKYLSLFVYVYVKADGKREPPFSP